MLALLLLIMSLTDQGWQKKTQQNQDKVDVVRIVLDKEDKASLAGHIPSRWFADRIRECGADKDTRCK